MMEQMQRIPAELNHTKSVEETNARASGQLYGGGLYRRMVEEWVKLYVGTEDVVCWRHGLIGIRELGKAVRTGPQEAAALQMLDDGNARLPRLYFTGIYHSLACITEAVKDATLVFPPSLWVCHRASATEFARISFELGASLAGSTDQVFGDMIVMPEVELPEELR